MAFFEKMGKTVTEAGQKTMAKTKDLADLAKLNLTISEAEKAISNQHVQIGKLYASLHKEDFEEAFAEMFQIISDAEEKINSAKAQIQEIKGSRNCEQCGAVVPNGAAFCSSCGAAVPVIETKAPESDDYVSCVHCGGAVKKGMRFCTSCGKPMQEVAVDPVAEESVEETPAEEIPVEEAPVEDAPQENACPNCGTKVGDDMVFCTECGTKLK